MSPASKLVSPSPQKMDTSSGIAPKGGAGKNFQASRLFEDEKEPDGSPKKQQDETYLKPNPTKYNHFDFVDGSEEPKPEPARPRPKSKHDSQWNFEDFTTPAKAAAKPRSQDVRNFGWSDDEVAESPTKKHFTIPKPRRDAESQFEFRDDGVPEPGRQPGHPRGAGSTSAANSLYQNNVYNEDGTPSPEKPTRPLSTMANIKDRQKDFAPHFDMTDAPEGRGEDTGSVAQRPNIANRSKTFGTQWDVGDDAEGLTTATNVVPAHSHVQDRKKDFDAHWGPNDDGNGDGDGDAHAHAQSSRARREICQRSQQAGRCCAQPWREHGRVALGRRRGHPRCRGRRQGSRQGEHRRRGQEGCGAIVGVRGRGRRGCSRRRSFCGGEEGREAGTGEPFVGLLRAWMRSETEMEGRERADANDGRGLADD